MKNKLTVITIISLILVFIALNTVIYLTVPKEILETDTFKIVWVFTFPINLLMAVISTLYTTGKKASSLVRMPPIMYLTYSFSILYLIVGMKMMTFYYTSYKIPLAIEIVITIVYVILFLYFSFGIGYVESTQKRDRQKLSYISLLKADIDMCALYAYSDQTKKQLEKLSEKIRFSDPMSSDSLAGCEEEIRQTVFVMMSALKADGNADVSNDIRKTEALLDYRNERCKILK